MSTDLNLFRDLLVQSGIVRPAAVESAFVELRQHQRQDAEALARILVSRKHLTPFQARHIYKGQSDRLHFGNYIVLDQLGRGGMGDIFKARHYFMNRVVALKVVSSQITDSPIALARFQREVRAIAQLSHPNMVTAFDADTEGETHFLVLEYVQGRDLSRHVQKFGPLSIEQALDCIRQAARGLDFAHTHGVVHRDVKPSNLMLNSDGVIKVLDLGLASYTNDDDGADHLTRLDQVMGTVAFMAPEQARGTTHVDGRADIYSLGATFWYLITGEVMYRRGNSVQVLMAHQNSPPPCLTEKFPEASHYVQQFFERMVAKDPSDRFGSMRELIAALKELKSHPHERVTLPKVEDTDEALVQFFRKIESERDEHAVVPGARRAESPLPSRMVPTEQATSVRVGQAPRPVENRQKTEPVLSFHVDTETTISSVLDHKTASSQHSTITRQSGSHRRMRPAEGRQMILGIIISVIFAFLAGGLLWYFGR